MNQIRPIMLEVLRKIADRLLADDPPGPDLADRREPTLRRGSQRQPANESAATHPARRRIGGLASSSR